MSEQTLQEISYELAEQLRGVSEDLATTEVASADMAAALELTKRLRQLLLGSRRERWYEGSANTAAVGPDGKSEYLNHSPIRGTLNPGAPPLKIETVTREDGTRAILGRVRLGPVHEGPPHGAHGGWIAALFDEVLGVTQTLEGVVGVTAILEVKYRSITPIDEDLQFLGWVEEKRRRRFIAKATCQVGDRVTAEAKGIFIPVDFDELLKQRLVK